MFQVALEERLLLCKLWEILGDEARGIVPPILTVAPRNDIVAFACERLPGPALSRFLGYVEVVDCMGEVSCALSTLPPPYGCIHSSMHEAEALAWHALTARTGQLWTLARMIISLLPFEDDDRAHGNGLVLHLGLYVKGASTNTPSTFRMCVGSLTSCCLRCVRDTVGLPSLTGPTTEPSRTATSGTMRATPCYWAYRVM